MPPKPITKAIYDTYDRLSTASAALDHKMELEQENQQRVGNAAEAIYQAKRTLAKNLGYDEFDEFLEAIWEFEESNK